MILNVQTNLHFDATPSILLFALGVVGGFVTGRAGTGQVRIAGKVAAGDECAHVNIVGEDIMADELTEEEHQIGELHALALVPRIGCKERGGEG